MTLRTDLLPIVEAARRLTGSAVLDQRPSQLTIRTRTWSGGRIDDGTATDSDLVLPQHYKIKELSSREIASSGGRYEVGDLRIVVTPQHDGNEGYSAEQLAPSVTARGVEVIYIVSGQIQGEYSRIDLKRDRPYRFELVIRRSKRSP